MTKYSAFSRLYSFLLYLLSEKQFVFPVTSTNQSLSTDTGIIKKYKNVNLNIIFEILLIFPEQELFAYLPFHSILFQQRHFFHFHGITEVKTSQEIPVGFK